MAKIYFEEHIEYIRSIAKGRYDDEITEMFNNKFTLQITKAKLRSIKSRYKISSELKTKKKPTYQTEHIDFLKSYGDTISNRELMGLFNSKYDFNLNIRQLAALKWRHNIPSKRTYVGVFEKGSIPWNKDTKGLVKANSGSFKKGSIPPNQRELGSEIVDKDGYVKVKVSETPHTWELKQRVIWEQTNGKIPEGYVIIFGDKDKFNFDIDNLICVSRNQLLRLNQSDLIQDDADLTKAMVGVVKLNEKIANIEREGDI